MRVGRDGGLHFFQLKWEAVHLCFGQMESCWQRWCFLQWECLSSEFSAEKAVVCVVPSRWMSLYGSQKTRQQSSFQATRIRTETLLNDAPRAVWMSFVYCCSTWIKHQSLKGRGYLPEKVCRQKVVFVACSVKKFLSSWWCKYPDPQEAQSLWRGIVRLRGGKTNVPWIWNLSVYSILDVKNLVFKLFSGFTAGVMFQGKADE